MTDDHITELQVAVLETNNGVPVFAATDGDRYWKDDYPAGSIDVAFSDEDPYDDAIELTDEPDVDWYAIEILDGGSIFHARYADDKGYGVIGDMPGEASSYLDFEEDEAFPAITDAATLDEQVEAIITSRHTDLYDPELVHWVVNDDALDTTPTLEDVEDALDGLAADPNSPVEGNAYGEYHAGL